MRGNWELFVSLEINGYSIDLHVTLNGLIDQLGSAVLHVDCTACFLKPERRTIAGEGQVRALHWGETGTKLSPALKLLTQKKGVFVIGLVFWFFGTHHTKFDSCILRAFLYESWRKKEAVFS